MGEGNWAGNFWEMCSDTSQIKSDSGYSDYGFRNLHSFIVQQFLKKKKLEKRKDGREERRRDRKGQE